MQNKVTSTRRSKATEFRRWYITTTIAEFLDLPFVWYYHFVNWVGFCGNVWSIYLVGSV
jgi:hypothetical protein